MALYPPIVASSMPAFDFNAASVKIYYNLSSYNIANIDDIKSVHITVRRQSSNVNVVNNSYEIILRNFGLQLDIDKILNRYFVEINAEDLKEGTFSKNGIYKVQLRFSSVSNNGGSNFYTNNINYFSEWSTVCIIKAILIPDFYINDFYTGQPPKLTDANNFYSTLSDFVGIYKQQNSSETLKNWRIRLLQLSYTSEDFLNIDNFTLSDSGIQLNEATNYNINDGSVVLTCSLPYLLELDVNYKLLFEIQTKNGYENSLLYNFTCRPSNVDSLTGELSTYINEEEGYIKLKFTSSLVEMKNLLIRRTDSRSNFLKWLDLKFFEVHNNQDYNFTYYDFTVLSGIFYRYLVQKVDARGRRGTPVYDLSKTRNTGVMAEWLHAFLLLSTGNGNISGTKQLKLKYDFLISSYKTNVSESKTDTIGSKYPFIRRNGSMYYRSFPVSGTITLFMDEADLFTNSNLLFDNMYEKYQDFKGTINENIGRRYDYTYERKFREKVELFLYNSKPKLYKSMQLGNIFIKLMLVSLTPKNELGRLVYSFSATAYEVDEACIKTYDNYNLIHIGVFNPSLFDTGVIFKQISSYDHDNNIMGNIFKAGLDIVGTGLEGTAANSIAKSIKYNESFNNKIVTDFTINYLRLTIESEPYLIIEDGETYRPFDDVNFSNAEKNPNYVDKNIIRNNTIESIRDNNYLDDITNPIYYPLYQILSTYSGTNGSSRVNVYLGWLFTINNKQIIIAYPNNIYELKLETFSFRKLVKIIPAKDTAMLVDFRLIEVREEDLSNNPKNIIMNKTNGQLMGTYSQGTDLTSQIRYKYKYTYEKSQNRVKRDVSNINTVLIDTEPGAIIYLKTTTMTGELPYRFVVNHTGELNFDPMDSLIGISSLEIVGMNILLRDTSDKGVVSSLSEIRFPKQGDICTINGEYYCYYRSIWYPATLSENGSSLDISCPVDALVFYCATIRERIF